MQPVYSQVYRGLFTGGYYFVLYLLARFGHYLFYAGRVYASVGHKFVQRQARYFTAHRVEAR